MISVSNLEYIIHLNNEGTAMLASSNERLARQAMNLFRQALAAIDELDRKSNFNLFGAAMPAAMGPSVDDVCCFCTVPVPALTDSTVDSTFFYCRQGIYLKPAALAHAMSLDGVSQLLRFFLAVVLMNTSLACYKVGRYFCLQQRPEYQLKANDLFHRSLHLYVEISNLYDATEQAADLAYFAMVAKNNLAWIFLHLGHRSHAKQAQSQLLQVIQDQGKTLTTPEAQECAKEFFLNTTIMSMTGYCSKLPAGAA
ncbi:expressed unknown protein [Seminavis robusta]|uniref:Uncharacterized protein n=1 Tax=Seminavis robusta TaxID=568900 RepID=A0A9N8HHT6_9STRA|nr:expressed unknown protein [Seminavis robusta]|eukprot:Sro582_g170530.1 n/a (254) ;mRNA; f:38207-38968